MAYLSLKEMDLTSSGSSTIQKDLPVVPVAPDPVAVEI
jgi:hypothetical protein